MQILLPQIAGPALVTGLWQGTLLAAAVWLCLRLVPQATAALRFALWTAVLLLVALLPLLESVPAHPAHPATHPLLHAGSRWGLALAALWAIASLLRAAGLVLQGLSLAKLHRDATPVPAPAMLAATSRPVQLCTSIQLDRPGVIGFFRPRILIPAWLYPQLTAPELEQIVLHELEHLRRRDDWLNLLQKLTLVLFPLNPVLIAIERLLCRERELACDDGVLRRTNAPRAYATCLATLAERGLTHRSLSLALGALGTLKRRSELYRRVDRILSSHDTPSPLQTRALTAAVALVLVGGSATLARCPQLVSFAEPSRLLAAAPPPPRPTVSLAAASQPTLHRASLPISVKHKPHLLRTATHHSIPRRPTLLPIASPETPHPRFLTVDLDLITYTAIRVEGGWLLLQL